MPTTSIIRTATPTDAEQIAFVHIESWRTTYPGIVTDEYLDKLNLQTRTSYWQRELDEFYDNVFVAENDGKIVGFATAGESREEKGYESELYAIYLLQQHQKKKLGRLLMTATVNYLLNCGQSSMYVWVLSDNNSKLFYERLGGQLFEEKTVEIGGQQLKEIAYGWTDLNKLVTTLT